MEDSLPLKDIEGNLIGEINITDEQHMKTLKVTSMYIASQYDYATGKICGFVLDPIDVRR